MALQTTAHDLGGGGLNMHIYIHILFGLQSSWGERRWRSTCYMGRVCVFYEALALLLRHRGWEEREAQAIVV